MRDEEIKEGEWGEKYREFFKRFPNAATNIENGIYICEHKLWVMRKIRNQR
ncbi:MAG: hypothetical protein IJA34_12055 [Lachnospiraceae bacterium]|nr:hypothetical protein [Lachnospiraceae bacterium]